ncbi:TonB-dependent receptor [Xanthovirga aplysinae]|uniref:TonB-dependent receptor n=1 Tax=Xanthovirga aplysinae TaxID=2529853 RepID=UPI0012BC97F7|nr:carboxypeptidase-like regulatory domain-containing protein [Xanthovirga aplysinae]MTI33271.1 hypothetical protein [Xanthovirga aplysinae]
MKFNFTILLFLFLGLSNAWAEETLKGGVFDEKGEPIIGATILAVESKVGAISDVNGEFSLKLGEGTQIIKIQSVGFQSETRQITISANINPPYLKVTLKESSEELDELVVYGKSLAEENREKAYSIAVVESKKYANVSVNLNQVLNTVPGINIREDGGLGSSFNLSLNGLTGRQVRVFIDGVPMDYFGSALGLNNYSANLIENIEVYKGVVPIDLSADALGGAINVVTNRKPMSFLDASYSIGSFNTHRASLNAQWYNPKSGFTVRTMSFYNYSDNNYKAGVRITENGVIPPEGETTEVERFHDAYESSMGQVSFGVLERAYADELMLGFWYAQNYKEIQNFAQLDYLPFGQINRKEKNYLTTLNYVKKDLLVKGLNTKAFIVYAQPQIINNDTSSRKYDWYGNYTYRGAEDSDKGEYKGKKYLTTTSKNLLANVSLQYAIDPKQQVAANFSTNWLKRINEDPYRDLYSEAFSEPQFVHKSVIGLSYQLKLFKEKLSTTLFTKNYFFSIQATNMPENYLDEPFPVDFSLDRFGFGMATSYKLSNDLQLKISLEQATRFPEPEEILGDGLLLVSNTGLQPEISTNANLGFRMNKRFGAKHKLIVEGNQFYRGSKDFIRKVARTFNSQFQNESNVSTLGWEGSVNYEFNNWLTLGANLTYQDIRSRDKDKSYYGSRIPNTPILFGNMLVNVVAKKPFQLPGQLGVSYTSNFGERYYLNWSELANDKIDIPRQYVHNLQLIYSNKDGRYNTSFSINNIFDAKVFDNYRLQKPGRSFDLKLRYFLVKQ